MNFGQKQEDRLIKSELVQISASDLQVGMYVSKLDRPWLETDFLFRGFELQTQLDIKQVQERCEHVFIDVSKQRKNFITTNRSDPGFSHKGFERPQAQRQPSNIQREFRHAQSAYVKTGRLVKDFMEEVSLGHSVNVELAKQTVMECVDSIVQSPDALLLLTQLKNKDVYTSQHSLNVCIYAIAIGRELNFPREELEALGLCGLMHDMGKMKIPLDILNKPDRLDPKEAEIMRSHSVEGMKILSSHKGFLGSVIDTAYGHHERLDGQGYPRRLKAHHIRPYTRIVSIADTYDAITSDRVYKKGLTHMEAINIMMKASGKSLDGGFLAQFIYSLGIYPPGNIVEMSNGEVAVVVATNPKSQLRPKISLVLDKNKQPINPRLIDLALVNEDEEGKPYSIKAIVRPENYDIDRMELYKLGILGLNLR